AEQRVRGVEVGVETSVGKARPAGDLGNTCCFETLLLEDLTGRLDQGVACSAPAFGERARRQRTFRHRCGVPLLHGRACAAVNAAARTWRSLRSSSRTSPGRR